MLALSGPKNARIGPATAESLFTRRRTPRPGGRFPTGRFAPRGPCPWGPSAVAGRPGSMPVSEQILSVFALETVHDRLDFLGAPLWADEKGVGGVDDH